jgi:hypothetical protein
VPLGCIAYTSSRYESVAHLEWLIEAEVACHMAEDPPSFCRTGKLQNLKTPRPQAAPAANKNATKMFDKDSETQASVGEGTTVCPFSMLLCS